VFCHQCLLNVLEKNETGALIAPNSGKGKKHQTDGGYQYRDRGIGVTQSKLCNGSPEFVTPGHETLLTGRTSPLS
jgi:hypothetical protein